MVVRAGVFHDFGVAKLSVGGVASGDLPQRTRLRRCPRGSPEGPGHGDGDLYNQSFPGGHTGGATPVPIPNTAVKPARADDSRKAKVGRCLDLLRSPEPHDSGDRFLYQSPEPCGLGDCFWVIRRLRTDRISSNFNREHYGWRIHVNRVSLLKRRCRRNPPAPGAQFRSDHTIYLA